MNTIDVVRTALFVPGNRPERVDKAVQTKADMVVIDLEDAVPLAEKTQARAMVNAKIKQHAGRAIHDHVQACRSGLVQQGDRDPAGEPAKCLGDPLDGF